MPTSAQLAAEINTDPKGLGYAGKSDYDISVLINTVGASGETIYKAFTPTSEIVANIIRAEYDALTAADKTYLNEVILKQAEIKTGSSTLRTQVGAIFGAATQSRANLIAVAQRSCSRAEALWGEGTQITDIDVAHALRG